MVGVLDGEAYLEADRFGSKDIALASRALWARCICHMTGSFHGVQGA